MRFYEGQEHLFRFLTVVRHQGLVIVLALDEKRDIYYRVLAPDPAQPDDDKNWSDRKKLALPGQIRPAGMSLVTVDLEMAGRTAEAPFQAVSDGKHVYLFRQSTGGTLYVDRFVFDAAARTLSLTWESRFQRSRKRDLPASRKDTFGAKDMEGQPFFEPTTELAAVRGLEAGQFCVLLLPGPLPTQWRWHIWAANAEGQLDSFSIGRGEDGLFSMADVQRTRLKWADAGQRFQAGPAALLYMQQEEALDEYGRAQRVKRGARVMLAAPVGLAKHALELDGADDHVRLGNPTALQIAGAITVEAWIKPRATAGRQDVVAQGNGGVYLRIQDGQYQVGVGERCASCPVPAEDLAAWVHLAGVYDPGQGWLLYRNGVQAAVAPNETDPAGAVPVAEDWAIGRHYAGQINNVRLWNVARTAEEIRQEMHRRPAPDAPGLAGYWPCDEGAGDTVHDWGAGQLHGQLVVGYALSLDGRDDYIELPLMNPDYAGGLTIEAWVRYRSFQNWSRIIDLGNAAPGDNILFANEGTSNNLVLQVYQDRDGSTITAPAVLETGTWLHLAATVDAEGKAALYKNGQLLTTGAVHVPRTVERTGNYLGRSNWGWDGYLDGDVGDVRLWSVARSQDQIQEGMHCRPAPDSPGLVCHWPCDGGAGDVVHDRAQGQLDGRLRVGFGLTFDGLDDHIELPAMNYDYAGGFTVEAWVRYRSFRSMSRIIDLGNGSGPDNILLANEGTTNTLVLHVYKGWTVSSIRAPGALETGTWLHLAATVDRFGNAALYKNGQMLVAGRVHVTGTVNRTRNYIGRSNWAADGYFDGDIGEVRLWNVARTPAQILETMGGPSDWLAHGMVGHWRLDEQAGSTVRDRVSGQDAVLRAGCAVDSHALFFGGSGDHVALPEMNVDFSQGLTVEAWVHYRSFKSWSRIIDLGNGSEKDNILLANEGTTNNLALHVLPRGAESSIQAVGRLKTGVWMHVAATVDKDGNAALYVDGGQAATGRVHLPATLPRTTNYLGRSNWPSDGYFDGGMQQVRLWNVARTADEIQATMYGILAGDEPGLVGYWPLDEGSGTAIRDVTGLVPHHGQLKVAATTKADDKWGAGPVPPDSLAAKWGGGPDNPDDKWRAGLDDVRDKWAAVAPIAVLDFGVARDGTLALTGEMQDVSDVTLVLGDAAGEGSLPVRALAPAGSEGGVAMPTIAVDRRGLTVSAGLLTFARSGDTPSLLDGADGLVHLYFRGDHGQFLVAQHDTLTARAEHSLPLDGAGGDRPELRFTALRPGPDMEGYEIAVAAGPKPGVCQVTLSSRNGICESWQNVPRDLVKFLAVLNGAATSDANDPLAREGRELVYYDYGANVRREGLPLQASAGGPFFGSALFAVTAANMPDAGAPVAVPNGTVQQATRHGKASAWIPEPEGKALRLDGIDDYVALPYDRLALAGDLAVEAWVKVAAMEGGPMHLVSYRAPGAKVALGFVRDEKGPNFKVVAESGGQAVGSATALVCPEEWTHVAAVYNATNALKPDGQGYVDCGNATDLNVKQAMTVEAWVTPRTESGRRLQPEVILAKWGAAEEEQSWRLYIDTDDKPCFETRDRLRRLIRVKGRDPLAAGRCYHLAAAFDATPRLETALAFDGKNNHVSLGNPSGLNFAGEITIAAWINAQDTTASRNVVAHGAGGAYLRIRDGHYQAGVGACCASYPVPPQDLGAWIHLAGVYDKARGAWLLFRNGIQVAQQPDPAGKGAVQAAENWNIGASFAGLMNNVRIWDRALSAAEVGDDMDTPGRNAQGTAGSWVFDDIDASLAKAPGGEIQDQSGGGHKGTLQGGLSATSYKSGAAAGCDKCHYEQKIWLDGDLQGWRWISIDVPKGEAYVAREKLPASVTARRLEVDRQVAAGDQLLLQDEQVAVRSVTANTDGTYTLDVDRAVNGIAREHRPGAEVSVLKRAAGEVAVTTTRLNIGRSASDQGYFQGIVDDVRLWETARRDWQIPTFQDEPLPADVEGLVADWRFQEGRGSAANDSKGSNHGKLVHARAGEVENMWAPVPRNAVLTLYINGRPVQTVGRAAGSGDGQDHGARDQFTIGAAIAADGTPQAHLCGSVDELRVWSRVRTTEQIRDNMYRALTGAEEGLAGYWPLDEGEGTAILDRTGEGQDGALQGGRWVDSTAPIGNEGPEVRNVCGGLEKPGFHKWTAASPAAVEYGDMQWDEGGNLFGVLKRCYLLQEDGLQLVTGFKVGDLELNFVGQVQTAPTLIGYIEGAPPVPSENLTDPQTDDYAGASAIQLTEAQETTQVYSASRDTGFDMSVDFKAGVHWAYGAEAGMFVTQSVYTTEGKAGVHGVFEHSTGWLSSASVTAGTSKTMTKSLTLAGGWEQPLSHDRDGQLQYLNPDVGRRYLPNNVGYALVKSGTADLFALRLKRTGSLVAFQVLPNPDIPEDWNIIMFPLNPKYIKNGTLDGMVGLRADPDYPGAGDGARGSYFKPLEAYALKQKIDKEYQDIRTHLTNYKAGEIGRRSEAGHFQAGDPGDASRRLMDVLPEQELGYDWKTGQDRRNMVNTYVWTAEGGFYAEEEQFSSIRQESWGGSYQFLGKGGVYVEAKFSAGYGFFGELDALFGGHINVEVQKSLEEKRAFGVHVDVQGEGCLNRWDKQQGCYTAELCPGKVDAYRFMTFYLAPCADSFGRFFDEIVDPEWLNGQGKYAAEYGPNARALREARSKNNQVWRVLHRVTYVSRILPSFEPARPEAAVPEDVRRPANVEANIGLILEIERIKRRLLPRPADTDLMVLGRAVDRLLLGGEPSDGQGVLEQMVPWWQDRGEGVKRQVRQDVMAYLKAFYESDLVPPEIDDEQERVTDGLQVLYTFLEGKGKTVKDVSGVGQPLDLTIADTKSARWMAGGGLALKSKAFVATSEDVWATKLIEAAKASHEITVEAWVKPASAAQASARIVSLTTAGRFRNFALGQNGDKVQAIVRTAGTDHYATGTLLEGGQVATGSLSHLVYTRDASGTARIYVNGVQAGERKVEGDFSTWNVAYRLGLGNEAGGDQPWLGELHLVAAYNRALRSGEVARNYSAGTVKAPPAGRARNVPH